MNEMSLVSYSCPSCSGKMTFNAMTQNMKCPYCDTEFETETLKAYDEVLSQDKEDNIAFLADQADWSEEEAASLTKYICESCGGEIVADNVTAATACPFCDSPTILPSRLAGDLRPDCVIPFALDKEAAKAGFFEHLKGKKLLPKVFKSEAHIDEIRGVYLPFWLFGGKVDADLRYRATTRHVWSDSDWIYTETCHYAVTRGGELAFEGLPVDGSDKMPDDLMESLEPFDRSKAVPFQTAFLSGYLADRYDVDAQSCKGRAENRFRRETEMAFRSTVEGYDTVIPEHTSLQVSSGDCRYALYPVWLLYTTWRGEKYLFAMNGQTGKFVGNLPVDRGIYWKYFALFAAIGTAVATGIGAFLSNLGVF